MGGEVVNYRDSIKALRNQVQESGRKPAELDGILREIDAPLWSICLHVSLLTKIKEATEETQKRAKSAFEKALDAIGDN
jgi:hypothetical protein